MAEYLQVVTTTETRDDALTIAREVVRGRAAACAQIIGPIKSLYWWKDELEEAEEFLCIMKTRKNAYQELEALIKEKHPYEVPEITAFPIETGSSDYLAWIKEEVATPAAATEE